MTTISLHQALTIFSWFALAVLLVILLLIARFYENMSGEKTRFWLFGAPIVIFGMASARYAFIDRMTGDLLGDVLWMLGGIVLAGMCILLYNLMTSGR
jgi:hypothetical protein